MFTVIMYLDKGHDCPSPYERCWRLEVSTATKNLLSSAAVNLAADVDFAHERHMRDAAIAAIEDAQMPIVLPDGEALPGARMDGFDVAELRTAPCVCHGGKFAVWHVGWP